MSTAVYTLNQAGRSGPGGSKTPYELWTGKKPNLNHKIFGSVVYVHTPKQFVKKFYQARSKKTILVGYQGDSSNCRLYNCETMSVSVSRNVVFNEHAGREKRETTATSGVEVVLPKHPQHYN